GPVSDVTNDTDDLAPDCSSIAAIESQAPANRVLIRQILARQRLVDDHHRRRIDAIALRENTAFLKLNVQDLEILGADTARTGSRPLAWRWRRLPLDSKTDGVFHSAQGQWIDRARGLYPRQRAQTLKQLLEKDRLLRRRVSGLRQPDLQRQNIPRIESRIDTR